VQGGWSAGLGAWLDGTMRRLTWRTYFLALAMLAVLSALLLIIFSGHDCIDELHYKKISSGMTRDEVEVILDRREAGLVFPDPHATSVIWVGKKGFIHVQFDRSNRVIAAGFHPDSRSPWTRFKDWLLQQGRRLGSGQGFHGQRFFLKKRPQGAKYPS
jgi:hypothetical protein